MKFVGNKIRRLDAQIDKANPSLVPKLPFSLQVTGQKGASKSTTIINMIMNKNILGGKFNQIYWISPTSTLDEKLNILKETKGIVKINYLLINEIKKNMKNAKRITNEMDEGNFEFNTSLTDDNFIQDTSIDFIEDLMNNQKKVIQKYGKALADNILLIYDDCSSAKKFWNSDITKKLIFNSRHVKVSIIFSVQNYTSISKPIRLNNSILLLYATSNEKELKNIYEENSGSNNFKEFLNMYKTVTNVPYSFLTINYQNDLKYRYINNFENFI